VAIDYRCLKVAKSIKGQLKEDDMSKPAGQNRKVIDCRLYPSEKNCSLTISGTEEEVLTVAVRHAVQEHGHTDSPELRQQLKTLLQDQ
jgi:hypothetical protein